MTPEELYQAEKAKRKAVGVKALLSTKTVDANDERFGIRCPQCKSEQVALVGGLGKGRDRKPALKTRSAVCSDCGHRWRTRSEQAFGGFRTILVRG